MTNPNKDSEFLKHLEKSRPIHACKHGVITEACAECMIPVEEEDGPA